MKKKIICVILAAAMMIICCMATGCAAEGGNTVSGSPIITDRVKEGTEQTGFSAEETYPEAETLSAGTSARISISSAYGKVGETVSLNVSMSGNPGIIALRLQISYDAKYVRLVKANDGGILGDSTATFGNDYGANPFTMLWEDPLSPSNHTTNGVIATLDFKIAATPPKSGTEVKINITDALDFDLNSVKFSATSGRITGDAAETTTTTPAKPTTTTTKTSTTTKKPTLTTGQHPRLDEIMYRLSGGDRIETAIAISNKGWTRSGSVVLASSVKYPDALAGVPLAGALNAPIILTGGASLEGKVLSEIKRLEAKTVYILGGSSAVSAQIEKSLGSAGCKVKRISGSDRYATAAAIAKELKAVLEKSVGELYFVSGTNFPDALSIGSIAAIKGCPILYVSKSGGVDKATAGYISSSGCKKAVVLGGKAAVSEAGEKSLKALGLSASRISGNDRYATALAIYKKYNSVFSSGSITVATGSNFPDALAGGAYAAKLKCPVILVGDSVSAGLKSYVRSFDCENVYIFGGEKAVSNDRANSLFA